MRFDSDHSLETDACLSFFHLIPFSYIFIHFNYRLRSRRCDISIYWSILLFRTIIRFFILFAVYFEYHEKYAP